MTQAEQQVNPRQKAALYALAAGILADWKEAYIAAHEERTTIARENAKVYTNVSHWKAKKKIQDYYAECVETITRERAAQFLKGQEDERMKADERNEKETGDSDRTDTRPPKRVVPLVDYSDPTNRKRLINEVIRDASDDPKTRLDAAKVFEQQQRDDKQAAKDNQIQRFYTPVTCRECPIKAAFAEKRRRKAGQAEK